ncbi:DUF1488 domain-containing protein [Vibrio sp. RE86]|uniref:DUF1488 domain-containing protein n=1 Tax=Vibrio sp. RE86 TaxID=2607605 RepID=UPI0014934A59|nr:DUF1488 domain-containing protein [Vibrio sp. RE86]NOH81383.1 DUF1488 domain-containing protein [Vibrio sp. RE86]
MNQSILFPDIQSWDEDKQAIVFPAQQSGALIQCLVNTAELEKLSGQQVEGEQQALTVFSQYRFDLEELAEELIEDEDFNSKGEIEITR